MKYSNFKLSRVCIMNTIEDPDIVVQDIVDPDIVVQDIVDLYTKIRGNPLYLEDPSEKPFVESPLHSATSEGRTGLALEILRLKPSLGKKLNLDGLSPLHLALGNRHTNTVRRLVKHDPDLVRVPGREGITLLHYAAESKGNIDLLIYFLLVCPLSIYDLTVRDETVAHIAVRNNNFTAFTVLLGWARRTGITNVLRWRNGEGNNLMHLAALTNQPEVMKSLIKFMNVNVNEKNLEGKTALDILKPENVEARKILISAGAKEGSSLVDDASSSTENYLKSNMTMKDLLFKFGAYLDIGLSGNKRNAILVVAVLIATDAFQATLTPPFNIPYNGNITSDTSTTNTTSKFYRSTPSPDKKPSLAKVSIIFNVIAFVLAMGTCVILEPLQPFLCIPVALFSLSYAAALAYGLHPRIKARIIIPGVVLSIGLPYLIILPWKIKLLKWRRRGDNYSEHNLDEMKYLIFGSTLMKLTSMPEGKHRYEGTASNVLSYASQSILHINQVTTYRLGRQGK